MVVYHGSLDRIEEGFRPLSHFGTEVAARRRIDQKRTEASGQTGYLHEVELTFDRALRLRDWGTNRPHDILCHDLLRAAGCPQWRISRAVTGGNPVERTVDYLVAEGYDAAVYANEVEDPGSLSYLNLTAGQATIQSTTVVGGPSTNG
jgi:hypothetical protein